MALSSERTMAVEYGVSLGTVRHAVRILRFEGFSSRSAARGPISLPGRRSWCAGTATCPDPKLRRSTHP
ncbi:MAG TPA: hypothetical protein VHI52_17665 [Verrucomicrobiae bacterium]|nr:hypothetical protein [Verrucomicrobiae bacterium]